MQTDREKAIHASLGNKNPNIPHSNNGEFALPKNEGGHRISRLFHFSQDRKLKALKKKKEQESRQKAIMEQRERAEVEQKELFRIQSGGKLAQEISSLQSDGALPKGFKDEQSKAQKFIVKQSIDKKRKRAEDIEMELHQLREDVKNPNKATKKFEVEEKEKKLNQEKFLVAKDLGNLNRLFAISDVRVGSFGTFSGNKEESTLPQGVLKARLRQKERDFERFRNPSKLFPSGSGKKRQFKNPDTGETELTSKLSPTARKQFEDLGLQRRFIGFDDEGKPKFANSPLKEFKETATMTEEEMDETAKEENNNVDMRSPNQVLSDILANPRGT